MTVDYLARFQKALGCRWRDLIAGLDAPPSVASKTVKPGKTVGEKKGTRPLLTLSPASPYSSMGVVGGVSGALAQAGKTRRRTEER